MSIKSFYIIAAFLFSFQSSIAQENIILQKFTAHNKGKMFFFWGGNRENFTKSDIHFKGSNYDFTIHDVVANDKPKGWHLDYINLTRMTIPQTNFRMGYFINDHYNIAIGVDHMKYVMQQNQTANVTGSVNLPSTEPGSVNNGIYTNTPVNFTDENFLTYEHTDGLNYVHSEISRVDDFSNLLKIKNTDKFQINLTEGLGAGILFPKTNSKLLGKERHDDFHVSGFGVSAKVGLNFTFLKYFFLQAELKGGYIKMNDIRTTANSNDTAEQEFFFLQRIIAFGGIFKL